MTGKLLLPFGLGSDNPAAPAVGFFGGVHGLERIVHWRSNEYR
jgi:hypothetical protein